MGFGDYKKQLADHGGGGLFISLKDGDSVKLCLMGDEIDGPAFYTGKAYVPCKWDDEGARLRVTTSAYVPGEGVKLLEGPEALYRAIGELSEDVDITRSLIAVKKVSNKKYECRHIRDLTKDKLDKIATMDALDLRKLTSWLDEEEEEDEAPAPKKKAKAKKKAPEPEPEDDDEDEPGSTEPEDDDDDDDDVPF